MSSADTEDDEKSPKKSEKFKIMKIANLAKMDTPEVLAYIETLHKILRIKDKLLAKYKEKFKQLEQSKQANQVTDTEEKQKTDSTETTTETSPKNTESTTSFVDEIRQAAEQAQHLSGFVYEPTSGLYYDQKTGYYYNAEYGLYYDGNTGCYYNYNQEKNVFEFHSQVEVQPNENATKDKSDDDNFNDDVQFDEHGGVITDKEKLQQLREAKRRKQKELEKAKKRKKKKSKKAKKSKKDSRHSKRRKKSKHRNNSDSDEEHVLKKCGRTRDMEDGELSESNSSSSCSTSGSDTDSDAVEENGVPIFKSSGQFQDIAKKYPPSLRIIVQETNIDALKVGSLSLITFKGGSLGREGDHDVIIPDVNVSKSHLHFTYDKKKCLYKCVDLGSRNGTILNGTRMTIAKVCSEPLDLVHGSVLQIGQTKLLCHIHEGNSTCGLCEPGLLIETPTERDTTVSTVHLTHKEQLKRLQKKYGLENEKFIDNKLTTSNSNYNDRAATRRIKVGSSTDKEKTQTASVSTAITSENKGFKMLSKLGWTEGKTLGKSQADGAILEPINVTSHEGKQGLGCKEPTVAALTHTEKKKLEASRKMQERYQKAYPYR